MDSAGFAELTGLFLALDLRVLGLRYGQRGLEQQAGGRAEIDSGQPRIGGSSNSYLSDDSLFSQLPYHWAQSRDFGLVDECFSSASRASRPYPSLLCVLPVRKAWQSDILI